ncbi:ellis-van Creveld syndrome protein [Tachyglossus aculeatus]|uniref:ellis-van Creveld syndrome protein n=1 Tax=Tachyglossus aculeatus TaxID=9261 RepID=UPI0018F38E44|nr:ellis-van Creveld syndrome protein [Tachyglossus aculeatus]
MDSLKAKGQFFLDTENDDSLRLLKDLDSDEHPGETPSAPRKGRREIKIPEDDIFREANESPFNSSLTTFALKAKVVYPINQKFRPLADGSSNPSLHEKKPREAAVPNQLPDLGSPPSSLGSLSRGPRDHCGSSSSSSSSLRSLASDDRFHHRMVRTVSTFPDVLLADSFDISLCLYSLHLKGLLLLDTELRQEKHMMFVHVFKKHLYDIFPKKKTSEEFYENILSKQQMDLKELEKQLHSRLCNTEMSAVGNSEYNTLEDIERKEREYAEHIIDNMEAFWKQTDKALQFLLDQPKRSSGKTGAIRMHLTEGMIAAEGLLSESQAVQAVNIQARTVNWEHVARTIESLKSQLQDETKCRLSVISQTLEALAVEGKLSGRLKEELLTRLHKAFWEEVSHFKSEFDLRGKDVVGKHLADRTAAMEELTAAQEEERETVLGEAAGDSHKWLKAFHELLEKQRLSRFDLEEEEDRKATDAVAELCQELHGNALRIFKNLEEEMFLQTLPGGTAISPGECEYLKQEMEQNSSLQLEKLDRFRKKRWSLFQEALEQEKQLWAKESAVSAVMQQHIAEKRETIIRGVLDRLDGLSEDCRQFLLRKHRLLLCSVVRRLSLRHGALATLTQMQMCRKKRLLWELRENHTLQETSSPCQDEHQWQLLRAMESRILEEDRNLEEETQDTRLELHRQLIMELQESFLLLQRHMEPEIGRALLQSARGHGGEARGQDREDLKALLVEEAVESVYVTSAGVGRLVHDYYLQIGKIMQLHEEKKLQKLKALQVERTENYKLRKKKRLRDESPRQKATGDSSDVSQAVHERLLFQQKKVLAPFGVHQQVRLDSLKQTTAAMGRLGAELESHLKEAEQVFIAELAALARVPIPPGRRLESGSAEKAVRSRRRKARPEHQEETTADAHDLPLGGHATGSLGQPQSQPESQVGDTEKPPKLLKRRSNV